MATPNDPWSADRIRALAPDERSIPAAREVLRKGGFGTVEATADGNGWWVVCQGITDTYQVSVRRETDGQIVCACNCPSYKRPCKHAIALLLYLADHPEERVEKEEAGRTAGDFEALIRAVFQNPDDDTPRLILADYLEETGQSDRAQFIRVQCEKERTQPTGKRFRELGRAEADLLPRIEARIQPLPDQFRPAGFRRGFLRLVVTVDPEDGPTAYPVRVADLFRDGWFDSVSVDARGTIEPGLFDLLRLAGEVDCSQSHLNESGLATLAAELGAVGDGCRVARVHVRKPELRLYTAFVASRQGEPVAALPRTMSLDTTVREYRGATAAQLAVLIRTGRLDGAHHLILEGPIGDEGAGLLAGTAGLAGLEQLTLTRSRIGPAGAAALAGSEHLAAVRQLGLFDRAMTDEAFAALCAGRGFPRLATLSTSFCLGEAAARTLGQAAHFPRLEAISWTGMPPGGAAAVLTSPNLPELADVRVEGDHANPADWLILAVEAADRPTLTVRSSTAEVVRTVSPPGELEIRARTTGPWSAGDVREAVAGLARGTSAKRATALALPGFGLDAEAVQLLAAALSPERVKELDLSGNRLGNSGTAAVASGFGKFRPEVLNLAHNNVRKTGAAALAGSPLLASVRVLDLSHNHLGFNGVWALANSPHLRNLKELRLQGTGLTPVEWREVERKIGRDVVV